MISRIFFCQKISRLNAPQCGNFKNFPPRLFGKNSVKVIFSLYNYTINRFHENCLKWVEISVISTQWCRNFHTVLCDKCINPLSHFFRKNFVKVTFSLKNLLKSWFDEFFFSERKFHVFPHCGMCKFTLSNFSQFQTM